MGADRLPEQSGSLGELAQKVPVLLSKKRRPVFGSSLLGVAESDALNVTAKWGEARQHPFRLEWTAGFAVIAGQFPFCLFVSDDHHLEVVPGLCGLDRHGQQRVTTVDIE